MQAEQVTVVSFLWDQGVAIVALLVSILALYRSWRPRPPKRKLRATAARRTVHPGGQELIRVALVNDGPATVTVESLLVVSNPALVDRVQAPWSRKLVRFGNWISRPIGKIASRQRQRAFFPNFPDLPAVPFDIEAGKTEWLDFGQAAVDVVDQRISTGDRTALLVQVSAGRGCAVYLDRVL